ncbi:MAG: 1-acyl-sn-glycerol-3-phosphate acyltransferase [Nitrospirae bacterium]|nr:1-acyl-sn-glycerol-3-phosphate acyltransferase [Nitrospirota bacterium]
MTERITTTLRSLLVFAFIYIITIYFSSLYVILSLFDRRGRIVDWVHRSWSRLALGASRVRVRMDGHEQLRAGRSYIIIANHQGFFDIWSLLSEFPLPVRMVFKKELLLIPIFGTALKRGGHICVDRSNRSQAVEQLKRGRDKVMSVGASLLFFAEGTRSKDGLIGPFKKGGIITAMDMGLPILPIAIRGSYEILQKKSMVIRPGVVRIRVLPEIPIEGWTHDRKDELTALVRERIVTAFEKL